MMYLIENQNCYSAFEYLKIFIHKKLGLNYINGQGEFVLSLLIKINIS